MGIKQRIGRAASNIMPGLESAWESAKAGGIDLISTTIGDPASDFLVGGDDDRGPLVLIDPVNGEEISYKGNKARFRELSYARTKGEPIDMIYQKSKKTVGEATDEYILDEFKKIKTLESSIKEVGSITKGIMSGDVEETVGGVINAVTSLITTIIPAALTRGASLFPQIVAPMYSDFNMTKADTKYPDSKEPIRELVENNETEVAIPLVLGGISMGLEAIGLKGISKQISKQTGKIAPFASLVLTNNKNGLQEVGQYGVENINKSLAEGNSPQDAFMDGLRSMASLDALENYAQGFVGSGIISAPSTITKALNGQPNSLKIINENIDKLGYLQQQKSKSSSKSFKQAIDLEISETEAKLKEHFTENYYVSKSFNKEQQSEIISIIDQKEKNNKIIQDLKSSFEAGEINSNQYGGAKSAVTRRNNKLSSEIGRIRSEVSTELLDANIKAVTKLADKVEGVKVKALDNAEAIDNFITENKLNVDKKASENQGFVYQNKETGEQTIIINKEVASKQRAVNVASHEFLHALVFQTVKDSPTTQVSLGNSLKSYLNKIDADQIKDSEFAKRLDLYKEDPNNVKAEEVITLFSDALATGDIKFNENILTKIGDVFRRILQSAGVNVKFNDGKDVYNFVKDYNKSISKGKLTKAQVEAFKGVKGSLVAEGVTGASSTDVKLSKKEKELGSEIKALVPEGTTKRRYDSRIIGDVYAKLVQGNTLDGLINGQLNKFGVVGDNVYGKPKDIFLEDVKAQLYEKSLTRFNPESNDDLGGFVVNELIRYRIGDVVNRYKKEAGVSGKSLDVAAGEVGSVQEIADESISIEDQIDLADTETRSKTKLIKATKVLSKEQYDKAAEIVKEKVKDIDPKNLSYKKVSGFVTDIVSKVIGVPAGKITDPKKNLSKGETTAGAMFIENNIDYIRKTLPKGAVTEAATEKLIGTATGVPNSVLKLLYDKNTRIKKGAGLSPWTLKKGLTNQDILDAIGRPKRADDKRIQIDPRSPEGQIIKGILSIVDKNIANELVRTVDSDLTLEQKQDVAAGKSATMFSKSIDGFDKTYNVAFSRKNNIELNNKYGFKNKWYDLDVMADDWQKNEAKLLRDYKRWVKKTTIGGFRPNFFISSKNTLNPNSKPGDPFYKEAHKRREATRAKIALIDKSLGKGRIGFGSPPSVFGKTVADIINNIENNKIEKANKKYSAVFDRTWISIAETARKDPSMIPFFLHFLETAGDTSHWHRLGAEFIAYDKAPKKVVKQFIKNDKKISYDIYYEYEHAVQSHIASKILLNAAFDKTVNFAKVLNDVKENYKLIALSIEDAEKLNKAGYALKMPEGWKHWWQRYFNDKVAAIDGGINPESIIGINNINLSEDLRVKPNGIKESKPSNLDKAFNDILENKSGIDSRKRYGIVEAITKGSSKGRFNFFIPPSAEDFVGLLYPTLGKGEVGDAQMSWYKKNLIDPYAESMNKLSRARIYLMNNYNLLKKQLDVVPKDLGKKVKGTDYTREQAVRVYIWNKQKMNIPGISDADVSKLTSYVADDTNLQTFGDQLINMQMGDGYIKPKESWPAGTITTDILEGLNTTKRAKYLKAWQENVDAIFSEENLNKLQAIYGLNYRKALENMLKRMKTGRNRSFPGDSLTGRVTDWLTGSVGTIMFLNTRSAVLQTISAINFVNFTDNNVLAAGKAFANQKQYWSDFMKLMNSDFLKERRGGLRINVNEADIADMAKKGGAKGAISKLLELGFAPTQIADSFAIASGGSAFYRNRINTYLKEKDANGNNLYTEKQAEKKAFEDFRETAEESQQSSRADRISQQQASPLGRVVLAFANTPAQYARIIKKAASDLKNGRGDAKTNMSKIIYYGFAQNLIFNALQQALFAVGFGDEEPEDKEKEKKYISIANGMLDSILRGSGIGGSVVSVGKNAIVKLVKELDKDRPKLQNIASEVLKISPPISAKYSRLVQAGKSYDWNKDEMKTKGLSLDNPAFLAGGNVLSALTNIPLDRAIKKANNVVQATSQDLETWERIALLGGWQAWELGIKEEKKKKKKRGTLKSGKIKTRKLDI